jgi:transcriptional regulator with XRE-family HTH domain
MPDDNPFGARLRYLRERRGLSREVFGGLIGRSADWVKAVENGRLLMPRLPLLLRIAKVLHVRDLATLTGELSIPTGEWDKASHDQTPTVVKTFLATTINPPQQEPDLPALTGRIDSAWRRYVSSPDPKTAIADALPALLTDARAAVRTLDGTQRRRALAELARVYSLTQCFFAYQPAAELVWLAADRAMIAAQDADDPLAVAAAAWYYGEIYREIGQPELSLTTALDCAELLDPTSDAEQRVRWAHLQMCAALSEAQLGNAGDAWRYWDLSSQAVTTLGPTYRHPWLRFGRADVDGFALRMEVRLVRPGQALRRADALDLSAQPGPYKRAWRLLDAAEAHHMRKDKAGAVYMIRRAHHEAPGTVRFSMFARQALMELSERRSAVRDDARQLATHIGLIS